MNFTKNTLPKTIFATLLLLAFITPALQAQYTLTDKDVTIERGTITSLLRNENDWGTSDIIIPDTISGQEVTGIGDDVFNFKVLTSLKLPKTITYIGNGAFSLNALSEIEIPAKTRFIGASAFSTNRLTKVTIPKSVVFIGQYAFFNSGVEELMFEPNSNIKIIGAHATIDYSDTTKIIFPTNNDTNFNGYYDDNGRQFQAGDESYLYTGESEYYCIDTLAHTLSNEDVELIAGEIIRAEPYLNIIIPYNINGQKITAIGQYTFSHHLIKSIELADGINTIKKYAFANCELTRLRLPADLKIIEENAFYNNRLVNLILPMNLEIIGSRAFYRNDIDIITIPNKVTRIEDVAFFQNNSSAVILPNSLIYIGQSAFEDNLFSEVKLPNSIQVIGKYAFWQDLEFELTKIDLPHPIINEGYVFTHWENGNDSIVTEMTDMKTSYTAQFTTTQSYKVSGTVDAPEMIGVLLNLTGDFDGVRNLNDDGTFEFPLNEGRTMTITPYHEGYMFFPESVHLDSIKADTGGFYFNCSIKDFDINFSAGENGTVEGELNQNRAYKQNTSPVTAVPNIGYKFIDWKDQEGTILCTENPIVIEVRKDLEVIAVFESLVGFKASSEIALQCYPNPVTKNLTIVAPQTIQKIELYNTLGEKVFTQDNINKNTATLNAAQYIKGVCFVYVTGKGFSEVVKVVVE